MISHPLVIAILTVDGLTFVIGAVVALIAVQTLLGWRPSETSERQLRLESRVEPAAIAAGAELWTFTAATVLSTAALTHVLPGIVPGAMCGTGVLQAMGDDGWKAIALRMAALVALFAANVARRLNGSHPAAPLTPWWASLSLFSFPFMAGAVLQTAAAFRNLDVAQPVNCCAVVYDAFGRTAGSTPLLVMPDSVRLILFVAVSLAVFGWALFVSRHTRPSPAAALFLAALILAWMASSNGALVHVLAAYIYQVLSHPCPWCLFLPEHHFAGFAFYGVWLWVGLEAAAAGTAAAAVRRQPDLEAAASRRIRLSAIRSAVGVALFGLLSTTPALWWRIQSGVWL
ncbi:MAG: hypothetical protein ACOWWM_03895 [Desulfobacterales bacterium]